MAVPAMGHVGVLPADLKVQDAVIAQEAPLSPSARSARFEQSRDAFRPLCQIFEALCKTLVRHNRLCGGVFAQTVELFRH